MLASLKVRGLKLLATLKPSISICRSVRCCALRGTPAPLRYLGVKESRLLLDVCYTTFHSSDGFESCDYTVLMRCGAAKCRSQKEPRISLAGRTL